VRDLLTWGRALGTGGDALPAHLRRPAHVAVPTDRAGRRDWYGLGVQLFGKGRSAPFLYHTGEVLGNEAIFQYYPATGAAVAILVNGDGGTNPQATGGGPLGAVLAEPRPTLIRLVNRR
jgi:Beta-lactamase